MLTLKEVKKNLETISTINTITSISQDIAQIRMNRIRKDVLKTRNFLNGLVKVYELAKKSYLASLQKKDFPKNQKKEDFVDKKTGKVLTKQKKESVAVFLSANEFFHGPLLLDVWREIQDHLKTNKADLMVIGKMGKYLAESAGFGHKLFYFQLDEDNPEKKSIKEIIEFLRNYEKITIFHGRFESVIHQEAIQTDISGGVSSKEKIGKAKDYLFEPSPKEVLEFFESEIIAALFNQVFLEHRLARYATKMMSMHQAKEKTNRIKKEFEREKTKLQRLLVDKEQLNRFSASSLWRQKTKK